MGHQVNHVLRTFAGWWVMSAMLLCLAACATPLTGHAPAATATATFAPSPTATPRPATVTEFAVPNPTGSIAATSDGRVWYGAGKTLNSVLASGARGSSITVSGTIYRVFPGPNGEPWALIRNNNGGWSFVRVTPGGATTFAVAGTSTIDTDYLIAGPDGAVWYLAHTLPLMDSNGLHISSIIGRLTASGQSQQFAFPQGNVIGLDFITASLWLKSGQWITIGPDHRIWMLMTHETCKQEPTEVSCNDTGGEIAAVNTSGAIQTYPSPEPNAQVDGIVSGPDGSLRIALGSSQGGGWIGVFTTSGQSRVLPLPSGVVAAAMTFAPDGSLWFTTPYGNSVIGQMTPQGVVTQYSEPEHALHGYIPQDAEQSNTILMGPDGDLWFTERPYAYIGQIASGATATSEVALPSSNYYISVVGDLIAGPNSTLWYARNFFNNPPNYPVASGIGTITP